MRNWDHWPSEASKTVDKLAKGFDIDYEHADELKKIIEKVHGLAIHGVDQIGWSKELSQERLSM